MARWQNDHVIGRLREHGGVGAGGTGADGADAGGAGVSGAGASEAGASGAGDDRSAVEALVVQTVADRRLDLAISQLGGKGAFAREVQAAVLDGRADLAVHSGKDLPSATPEGLVVAAVLARHDPRDCLVGARLADLSPGSLVGTGSPRRRAQLAWLRPDLCFRDVRGNVGTRLAKLDRGEVDVLVLAYAGLRRLGLAEDRPLEVLEPDVMVPQVAQGTLVVECRADDAATRDLLSSLDDPATRRTFDAERSFLAALGGDCSLPAGAFARLGVAGDGAGISLEAMIASLDGHVVLRHRLAGDDPAALGAEAASFLLDRAGGRHLLEG
jgi:hydroxymethylbilane synthase